MAYTRRNTTDGVTVMNKDLYDNLQDGIDDLRVSTVYMSSFIKNKELISGFYLLTNEFISSINNLEVKRIVVNVPTLVVNTEALSLRDNLEIYSPNKSILKFGKGFGFDLSSYAEEEIAKNISIHDLTISGGYSGYNTEDSWLIHVNRDVSEFNIFNLELVGGYNGILIEGWVLNIRNIRVDGFEGVGVKIRRSDNTFSNFYINGCKGAGLDFQSSNNRLSNFKILSCGKKTPSVLLGGARNFIIGLEIQDIFYKAAELRGVTYSVIDVNLDGIRTNLETTSSLVLASFNDVSNNFIRLISNKYKSGQPIEDNDIIECSDTVVSNSIFALLSNVIFNKNTELRNFIILNGIYKDYKFLDKLDNVYRRGTSSTGGATLVSATWLDFSENDIYVEGFSTQDTTYGGIRFYGESEHSYFIEGVVVVDKESTIVIGNQEDSAASLMVKPNSPTPFRYLVTQLLSKGLILINTSKNTKVKFISLEYKDVTKFVKEGLI